MTIPSAVLSDVQLSGDQLSGDQPAYLYCLVPGEASFSLEVPGIDPHYPVFRHDIDGMTAVVSGVALKEFTGPAGDDHLQDLNWVAPRAAKHAGVVENAMARAPVMPVRFGTIFSSLQVMTHSLGLHRKTIHDFLSYLDNQKEFALKGYMDPIRAGQTVTQAALDQASEKLSDLSPGARYFAQKRLQQQSQEAVAEWLHQVRLDILDGLAIPDDQMAELKLQSGKHGEDQLSMVLNWALLVSDPERSTVLDRVAGLNADWQSQGITLECTGPWPPYSFCPQLVWKEPS